MNSRMKVLIISVLAVSWGTAAGASPYGSASWSDDTYAAAHAAARILQKDPEAMTEIMQVGSISTVVHEKPSVDSPAVGVLLMGDAVRVREARKWYRVPGTSLMNELGERALIPSWVKIESPGVTGYVSTRSLVHPEVQAKVDAEAAKRRGAERGGDAGGGFSRNVKRKKKNLAKGVAGTPPMANADYALVESIITESPTTFSLYRQSRAFAGHEPVVETAPKHVGVTLAVLDPEYAAKLAAANAPASEEEESGGGLFGGGGGGLLGGGNPFGGGSNDLLEEAAIAERILEIITEMTAERTATPLEEYYLGRECAAMSTGGAQRLPASHPLSQHVTNIGHSIARHSTMPYPTAGYHFTVLNDDQTPNAIAAPGGFIFITTGMLKRLKTEDQLAVILAHEVAHCEERHGIMAANEAEFDQFSAFVAIFEMAQEQILDEIIEQALGDITVPAGIDAVGEIRAELIEMATEGFQEIITAAVASIQEPSHAAERAADERGMALACAAGYDPGAMAGLLATVKETTGTYGGAGYSETRGEDAEQILLLLKPVAAFHESEAGIAERDGRTARFRQLIESMHADASADGGG
jgi:hypothetical protein